MFFDFQNLVAYYTVSSEVKTLIGEFAICNSRLLAYNSGSC